MKWMFAYAVHVYGVALEVYYQQFLQSSISECFASGDSSVLAGMSGAEMAYHVIHENDPHGTGTVLSPGGSVGVSGGDITLLSEYI